jgi:hypothetical protein
MKNTNNPISISNSNRVNTINKLNEEYQYSNILNVYIFCMFKVISF